MPQSLTGLYQAVVPLWQRHLATAQDHAELAVTEMLAAFTDIHPYLERSLHQSQQLHAAVMASDDGLDHLAQVCDSHLLPLVPGLDADGADAVLQVLDAVHRVVGRVERIARPVSTDPPTCCRWQTRIGRPRPPRPGWHGWNPATRWPRNATPTRAVLIPMLHLPCVRTRNPTISERTRDGSNDSGD